MGSFNWNKRQEFRNLDDIYKTPKFLKLYTKIWVYFIDNNDFKSNTIHSFWTYIECFLKAKDFYHWKERIYALLTTKIHNSTFRKYELLYGQKAREFWNEYLEKIKKSRTKTNLERYGCENPFQVKKVKEKIIQTNLERYGCENPSQSKDIQSEKRIKFESEHPGYTCFQQTDEWKQKITNTNMERYGVDWYINKAREKIGRCGYSRIANEFFEKIEKRIELNCQYAKHGREFRIDIFKYDFCIPEIKVIVEFDGLYWHGLMEGQKDVRGVPVEEVWKRDAEKQKLAEMNGFKVIRVREDEYMKDKEEVLNNIVEDILLCYKRMKQESCIEK